MNRTDRTQRLKALMQTHALSPEGVSQLLGRSVQTVYIWRNGDHRAIPPHILELLELKLGQGKAIA